MFYQTQLCNTQTLYFLRTLFVGNTHWGIADGGSQTRCMYDIVYYMCMNDIVYDMCMYDIYKITRDINS